MASEDDAGISHLAHLHRAEISLHQIAAGDIRMLRPSANRPICRLPAWAAIEIKTAGRRGHVADRRRPAHAGQTKQVGEITRHRPSDQRRVPFTLICDQNIDGHYSGWLALLIIDLENAQMMA